MSGQIVKSIELDFSGSNAVVTLREVPNAKQFSSCMEASFVLSSPGVPPLSAWARFPNDDTLETLTSVSFNLVGVGLQRVDNFVPPWPDHIVRSVRSTGSGWDQLPGWAARGAEEMGHPTESGRRAAAYLGGVVEAALFESWAILLVRSACILVPPERVMELAREAAVVQVMEG